MQTVDKNGTKTLLRFNEVVVRRRRKSSNSVATIETTPPTSAASALAAVAVNKEEMAGSSLLVKSLTEQMHHHTEQSRASSSSFIGGANFDNKNTKFLIEFMAGAAGGALSRTAYVLTLFISIKCPKFDIDSFEST